MGPGAQTAARPDLLARLQALFDAPVAVAVDDPRAPPDGLFPSEWSAVERAVEPRRREFAAGRRAAREAMAKLGRPGAAVPMADDRAPIWPGGLVGSISHNAEVCVAVVAERGAVTSLGLDIEAETALEADLVASVCTVSERAWLNTRPVSARRWLPSLLFSAKEAAYKCQYPVSGQVFDFQTLEITPDLDLGVIEARFAQTVGAFGAGNLLSGRFFVAEGLVATGFTLAAD